MSIVQKIRACNGLTNYMSKFETGFTSKQSYRKQDIHYNNIILAFAKDLKLEGLHPNNSPRYRGSFNPLVENSVIIQENWKTFSTWMRYHYDKIT